MSKGKPIWVKAFIQHPCTGGSFDIMIEDTSGRPRFINIDYTQIQRPEEPKEESEPTVNQLPQENEDIAKAFQLGMAFGFAKKHDEMDKVIEEVKKAIAPKYETVTEFAERCCECGARYGKLLKQARELEPCEDCISRQFMYELGATCIATRNENGELIALGSIEEMRNDKNINDNL